MEVLSATFSFLKLSWKQDDPQSHPRPGRLYFLSGFLFIFLLFAILPIYLVLLCPRGCPIWRKAFESSYQTPFSTLTWPSRDDFSIPAFSGFLFLPRATLFFLTHPDQSVPCSDWSALQIVYVNFFQTAFSSSFFIPAPDGFLRNSFYKCPADPSTRLLDLDLKRFRFPI